MAHGKTLMCMYRSTHQYAACLFSGTRLKASSALSARLDAGRNSLHILRMDSKSIKPAQDEEFMAEPVRLMKEMVNRPAKAMEKENREGANKAASHVRH